MLILWTGNIFKKKALLTMAAMIARFFLMYNMTQKGSYGCRVLSQSRSKLIFADQNMSCFMPLRKKSLKIYMTLSCHDLSFIFGYQFFNKQPPESLSLSRLDGLSLLHGSGKKETFSKEAKGRASNEVGFGRDRNNNIWVNPKMEVDGR